VQVRRNTALLVVPVVAVALAGGLIARAETPTPYDPVAATAPVVADGGAAGVDRWTTDADAGRLSNRGAAVEVALRVAGPTAVEQLVGTPVRPHSVYRASFAARAGGDPAPVTASLTWYDHAGRHLVADDVRSATVTDDAEAWTTIEVAGLTPATAATVRLVATFAPALSGATHFLAAPSMTVRPQGSDDLVGPLSTQGTQVLDAHGRPVVLRGINRAGQWDVAQPGGLDARDLERIKAWGANSVRLTLGEAVWLPGCTSYDPGYRTAVATAVRQINDLGMLAVLDLHYSAPTCGTAGPNPMPDTRSALFWQQVARAYRDRPLVAFDLYNEPYGVSPAVWRDGGLALTDRGVPYRAVGMRTLFRVIRAAGATNLVLTGGLGKAADVPGSAWFTGSNLVWSVHTYVCSLPWLCTTTETRRQLDALAPVARRMPVVVTEFGHPASQRRDASTFNAWTVDYAEQHHWGWMVWAWDVHGTCRPLQYFNLLTVTSCGTGTGTYEPSPQAVPVLIGLGRNTRRPT
jgi:hypothetical protein